MSIIPFNTPVGKIFWGHLLMFLCSIFYLVWWITAFKPHSSQPVTKSAVLLSLAALAGVTGILIMIQGIRTLPHKNLPISNSCILLGGLAAYVVLFVLTYVLFKRQVTTELLLIVGWAVLELCSVNVLYGAEQFSTVTTIVFCCVIVAAVIASLICYILYYQLGTYAGYVDGMLPLIIAAVVMTGVCVKILM